MINLNKYKSIESYWIALYVDGDSVKYFDSFGFQYISTEFKKFIGNKNIKTNIYRKQADDSTMCG